MSAVAGLVCLGRRDPFIIFEGPYGGDSGPAGPIGSTYGEGAQNAARS